ncbi:MAG: hypothetical protein U0174_25750 [Polyangiaceae bacterium]
MRPLSFVLAAVPLTLFVACSSESPVLQPLVDAGAVDARSDAAGNHLASDGAADASKPSGVPLRLADVPFGCQGLAVARDSVFVGASGNEIRSLIRVPKDGSAAKLDYYSVQQAERIDDFAAVDADLLTLVTQASGSGRELRVVRKNVTSGAEAVVTTNTSSEKKFWHLIGADASSIYLSAYRDPRLDVYRVSKSGGTLEAVFYVNSDVYDLQLAGDDIWFTASNGDLFRVPKNSTGALAKPSPANLFCAYGMAVHGDRIYCAGGDGKVDRMALDQTSRTTLYDATKPLRADLKDKALHLSLPSGARHVPTGQGFLLTFDVHFDERAPIVNLDTGAAALALLPWGERFAVQAMTTDAEGTYWLEEERGQVDASRIFRVVK